MEIIAETGSGINTPLYDSIALHIVAVRRIFSDDPGHRPPAGQEKRPFGGLPFRSGTSCSPRRYSCAPRLYPRSIFCLRVPSFSRHRNVFFTFSLFWSRMNKNALSYRDSLMKLQRVFSQRRYFHRLQAGFLLIELLFSLPSDSKKAASSRLGESRFLLTG